MSKPVYYSPKVRPERTLSVTISANENDKFAVALPALTEVIDLKPELISFQKDLGIFICTKQRMPDLHRLSQLGDVFEGGATVFPQIGVRVPVVKNGAAFWYNLHRNGETDPRLQHAGCPVLLGQKWIANKWIRELGQEFRHSCGLTPDTPHYL